MMNNENTTTATETNTNSIPSWLPCFDGFYGSYFDADNSMDYDSEIEYYESEECEDGKYKDSNLNSEDFEWDNDGYQKDITERFTDVIRTLLVDSNIISGIENETLVSPRFYNFSNDSINCDFLLSKENEKAISEFINSNSEEFTKYLTKQYTSCDGFISSHSNDFSDWSHHTNNFTFADVDFQIEDFGHALGSVLQFIAVQLLLENGVDSEDDISSHLYYETTEDFYASEYLQFNEELFKSNREQ